MPDIRRKRCRLCNRHEREIGLLSWQGYCGDCGIELLTENVHQMHDRRGPNFDRWRRAMAASVGGVLVDDVLPPS
jgi:hypothetical protein